MTIDLHAIGGETDVAGLRAVVAAFRATGPVVAGLVLPWDRPATREDLDLDPAESTRGALWAVDGECRWRVEGDRGLVTVLLEVPTAEGWTPPDGVRTELLADVAVDDGAAPVAWARTPFSAAGGSVVLVERLYRTGRDGHVHRRLRPATGAASTAQEE